MSIDYISLLMLIQQAKLKHTTQIKAHALEGSLGYSPNAKLAKFIPSNGNKVCFCPLCNKQLETAQQFFFLGCDIVRIIWRQSNWPLKIHAFENLPIGTSIKLLLILQNMFKYLLLLSWTYMIWVKPGCA
jgi:hypothetical protein